MFSFLGRRYHNCDGISRREFLSAGSLSLGGALGSLSLADLLRAEDRAGVGSSRKAIINIHLDGGPPQMDLVDPKPEAPQEIRGEFAPIATRLTGVHFTELLPKLAGVADKLVTIRSLVGSGGAHDAFQVQSGYLADNLASLGGRPALGCVVSRLQGSPEDPAPAFVDLMQGRPLVRNSARPGFLGPAYSAFRPDISHMFERSLEDGMKIELARKGANHQTSLSLAPGLSARRLSDRTQLRSALDRINRQADTTGMMDASDRFTQQAISILTSGRFADALDVEKEDPRVLAEYAVDVPIDNRVLHADYPIATRKLLLARRLIEVGVRCVSLSLSDFDTHSKNTLRLQRVVPIFDHALATLICDLERRGMLDDVLIVAWGEFGRTPKINSNAGRDHWPAVAMALLAGGGLRTGQVIGSTDRHAGAARTRPVHVQEVFATLYHHLGIDPEHVTIEDPTGRPQYLLDRQEPIAEVV